MLHLTQLTGMVLLVHIHGAQSNNCSDLVLEPPELEVKYGDNVSVSCHSLSNNNDPNWIVQQGIYYNDNMTTIWEADNLTDWDEEPMCNTTLDGMECSRILPLTIYKLPDLVSISTMNHSGPMAEGREYKLQCDIQNVAPTHLLTVAWYKGPDLVNHTSFTNVFKMAPSTASAELHIKPSRGDDGIQYKCEAQLNLKHQPFTMTSDPLIINVTAKPQNCSDLVLDPPELVVKFGEPVTVSCRSLSNDTDLVWSAPHGNIISPDNKTIIWKTDNLTDWEAHPVCHKTLDCGKCEKALRLIVYKIPEKVTISVVNHTGPLLAGKKYDLQCDIENFAPVNVLAVFWYKGEKLMKNRGFSDLPTKTPSNKMVTYRIIPAKNDSNDPYWCAAKMKLGATGPQPPPNVTSNRLSIAVHYKPTINCMDWSPLENTSLSSYPYTVKGNPVPEISWFQDKSKINSDKLLNRSDSGQYTLNARNVIGNTPCTTKITVEYPPTFNCSESYTRIEKESFLDQCSVMASPVATITWTKDGKRVSAPQNLQKNDSGEYVITAENKHGTEQHRLTLMVLDECPITIQPAELVVEFGASATANCSTSSVHSGMGWEAVEGGIDMTQGVQFLIWRVDSVTYWSTKPVCYINANKQCNVELPVTLYKRPDLVSINTLNHTGPMTEGSEYKLECEVQNVAPVRALTVNWYKGQSRLPVKSEEFHNILSSEPQNISSNHAISTNKEDDGIQYTCEAVLNLGPEGPQPPPVNLSDPLTITVHYKPTINCMDWSPLENTSLSSYPYNAKGNPVPNITWYRDQSKINSDTILNRSDSGQYTLNARNVMGNTPCTTKITVEYPPTFTCSESYTRKEKESFLDQCSVMASPVATITWTKDGKRVSPPQNLQKNDSGEYVITAENKHGTEQHRLTLNIQYPPEIQPMSPSEVVMAGRDVFLTCTATGNPEPEVQWSFQNQTKATGRRQTTLNISKAQLADAGHYLCTATNIHGNPTKTVSLTVQESNMRTILITCGVLLAIIILVAYVVYNRAMSRRSGKYNVQTNGEVSMTLLNK